MFWCWLSLLLSVAALQLVAADYPEIDVHGEEFGWTQSEYDKRAWHRINDSSACRELPPTNKNIMYLMPRRIHTGDFDSSTRCRYMIADPQKVNAYEMEIDKNGQQFDNCFSHRKGIHTDPNCQLGIVSPRYVMMYCQLNSNNYTVGYLAELKRVNGLYRLVLQDRLRLTFPTPFSKDINAIVRFPVDEENVLFVANNPPRLVHVSLTGSPKLVKSLGGTSSAEELRNYIRSQFPALDVSRFFTCETNNRFDGKMCELIYEAQPHGQTPKPLFKQINGAFNQYECLRIRRGLVRYEASATDVQGLSDDEPFGYVIENFQLDTGKILSQKCYFSPNFKKRDRVSSIYPVWIGTEAELLRICTQGLNRPPAPPYKRTGTSPCQTALFPSGAEGAYRIVGMEPNNKPERGVFGVPRLAVYNGVDTNPEFIGDPGDILKENCYTEENRDPTGLAHFGIRVLDPENYLVFCNKLYGTRVEFTDEQRRKGSSLILYRYLPPIKEGPQKRAGVLTFQAMHHLQVVNDDSFLRFLDNRAVVMIPKGDGKVFYFVQMMPCAYWKLDCSDPQNPKFTVKPPNTESDYKCAKTDVNELTGTTGIKYEDLLGCATNQCLYEDGQIVRKGEFEPSIYVNRDMLFTNTSVSVGKVGCVDANLRLVNESGLRTVFTFDPEDVVADPKQPCFMPFNRSSSFQIIKLNNSIPCSESWNFAGPPVTLSPSTTIGQIHEVSQITNRPAGAAPGLDANAACTKYYVDTLSAVAMAALALLLCFSVFAAVVLASMLGRRKFHAQKPPETTGQTQTEATVASTMTNIPTTAAPPTATAPPTDLFSKIGDFQPARPSPAPNPSLPANSRENAGMGAFPGPS